MPDREKVMAWLDGLTQDDWRMFHSDSEVQEIARNALALLKEQEDIGKELTDAIERVHKKNARIIELLDLLKEQEEREKRICKAICDLIRGSCSTDTYADKEFVCHEIQKCFMKGR